MARNIWHGEMLVLRNVSFSRNLTSALKFSHILFHGSLHSAIGGAFFAGHFDKSSNFHWQICTDSDCALKIFLISKKWVLHLSTSSRMLSKEGFQQPNLNIYFSGLYHSAWCRYVSLTMTVFFSNSIFAQTSKYKCHEKSDSVSLLVPIRLTLHGEGREGNLNNYNYYN